ncbi:MAG TPA: hypothetical protein VFB50_04170 [Chloroflexota bacterium]|nr:hypothetical protein [Chloroflexota bacterium]
MKRIRLLSLPDPRIDRADPQYDAAVVDYRTLVEAALRVPLDRQNGATIAEMRKSMRVLDALDCSENGILELEDADWQVLKDKVEKMPWAMVDRRILEFCDDVMEATDAPKAELAAASNSHA